MKQNYTGYFHNNCYHSEEPKPACPCSLNGTSQSQSQSQLASCAASAVQRHAPWYLPTTTTTTTTESTTSVQPITTKSTTTHTKPTTSDATTTKIATTESSTSSSTASATITTTNNKQTDTDSTEQTIEKSASKCTCYATPASRNLEEELSTFSPTKTSFEEVTLVTSLQRNDIKSTSVVETLESTDADVQKINQQNNDGNTVTSMAISMSTSTSRRNKKQTNEARGGVDQTAMPNALLGRKKKSYAKSYSATSNPSILGVTVKNNVLLNLVPKVSTMKSFL